MKRTPLAVIAALLAAGCSASAHQARRPNVLFIAVDDLRPELGAYGNTVIKTPNIDRLAASGVTFVQAYVQQAVCNPSRASLLTGLRPDSLQVWDLQTEMRSHVPDVVTLPQYFAQHGYATTAIGKIEHNRFPDDRSWSIPKMYLDGFPFDADAVYAGEEGLVTQAKRRAGILASRQPYQNRDRFGEYYLKAQATESADVPDDAYYDGAQTTAALAKIGELAKSNAPFFFGIGYYRPHLPFNAPKKYWDLYDRSAIPLATNPFVPKGSPLMAVNNMRELGGYTDFKNAVHPTQGSLTEAESRLLKHGYYASVSYVDAQIGRLLNRLEELGIAGNTIVVLWGDHGWKLGEHNSWTKMTNFDIDTRAPLLLRAPGRSRPGTRLNQMVEFVDIFPTITELAGLPVPAGLEGVSAVPLLAAPNRPWKKAVFSQFLRDGIWVAPDGIPYMGYSVRTDRYRYTAWMNWTSKAFVAWELYDHASDPDENVNVVDAPEYARTRAELEAMRVAGWKAAGRVRE